MEPVIRRIAIAVANGPAHLWELDIRDRVPVNYDGLLVASFFLLEDGNLAEQEKLTVGIAYRVGRTYRRGGSDR